MARILICEISTANTLRLKKSRCLSRCDGSDRGFVRYAESSKPILALSSTSETDVQNRCTKDHLYPSCMTLKTTPVVLQQVHNLRAYTFCSLLNLLSASSHLGSLVVVRLVWCDHVLPSSKEERIKQTSDVEMSEDLGSSFLCLYTFGRLLAHFLSLLHSYSWSYSLTVVNLTVIWE